MPIVKAESNSHWYLPDGTPFYELDYPETSKARVFLEWKNNGKQGPRPRMKASLRDARKVGALPSVTNIISILEKPQLIAWKVEQGIIAALTMPDRERQAFGDDLDALAAKVAQDADETKNAAAKFGSAMHSAIENWIMSSEVPDDTTILPHFEKFVAWWNENVEEIYWTEQCLVGDGYAGRGDLKARIKGHGVAIVDFKTRKQDGRGKFASYDEDGMQLAAYREADMFLDDTGPPAEHCISLYINSGEPKPPVLKVWDQEDITRLHRAFLAAKDLWTLIKKYDPQQGA